MKSYIEIGGYEYLNAESDEKTYRKDDADAVLVCSAAANTSIRADGKDVLLPHHHVCVYRCDEEVCIGAAGGRVLIILLKGSLVKTQIKQQHTGKVYAFCAGDRLSARAAQIDAALTYHKRLDDVTLTEIGFEFVLDLWSYKEKGQEVSRAVRDAIELIDNAYGMLYGVDDLADRVGVSKSHLIRQFQDAMHTTPGAYLENVRIEKAKALLTSGGLDIKTVAQMCGYSGANYFAKVFKKRQGISPSAYAKKNAYSTETVLPDELYL